MSDRSARASVARMSVTQCCDRSNCSSVRGESN